MTPTALSSELLTRQLGNTLTESDLRLPGLRARHQGKVRDSYVLGDGRRVLVTTDRISAFDVVLGTLPFKGQVLNQLSAYWFRESAAIARNHMLAVPDPCVMVARECEPIPVEMVMRAYLTGVTSTSIWHAYERGERTFCGHRLPEGLRKNEPLPALLCTPSTKAGPGGHDESVSGEELVRRGLVDAATFAEMSRLCAALFLLGQERARQRGLILVDTKYELGRLRHTDGTEEILFIDEVHTPDSSRYWYAADYEERLRVGQEPRSLDKEYVRRYLASIGYRGDGPPPPLPDEVRVEAAQRYIEAYELLTGGPFQPDLQPPLARLTANLEAYLR